VCFVIGIALFGKCMKYVHKKGNTIKLLSYLYDKNSAIKRLRE